MKKEEPKNKTATLAEPAKNKSSQAQKVEPAKNATKPTLATPSKNQTLASKDKKFPDTSGDP